MVRAIFTIGIFVLLIGTVIVGVMPPGSRAWAAGCVAAAIGLLLTWLLVFAALFGVAA